MRMKVQEKYKLAHQVFVKMYLEREGIDTNQQRGLEKGVFLQEVKRVADRIVI